MTISFLWMVKQAQRSTQPGSSIWTHVCSSMLNATLRIWLEKKCGQLDVPGVCYWASNCLYFVFLCNSRGSSPLGRRIYCFCFVISLVLGTGKAPPPLPPKARGWRLGSECGRWWPSPQVEQVVTMAGCEILPFENAIKPWERQR